MGTFGRRPVVTNNSYSEPILIRDVNDILSTATNKKWIDSKGNVDIEQVAKWQNINIVYDQMDSSISGYLKMVDGQWVIGVNRLHNPKRQRFTIAHELGHYYMHKEKNVAFEDTTFFRNNDSTSIEYSANEFAANLLMPEDRVKAAIKSGVKSIEKLSTIFNVSVAAIKYRVVALGYKLKS